MIPEYPKLKPIEPEDRHNIFKYLDAHPASVCELAPANLYIWKDFDRPQATLINGNLCVIINPMNEAPYFLEPVGRNLLKETVRACLSHTGRMSRASKTIGELLTEKECSVTPIRNQFDYVYLTKELAELKGKKFDGKRNHIRKFQMQNPDHQFLPLAPKMKAEALALFEKWFEIRKESRFFPKLAHRYQRAALETAFSMLNELSLTGGAVYAGKTMKGFIIGSRLNPGTACAHFSYGDPGSQGISQILLWEAANKLFNGYEKINLEQDLGIPGLRTAKLSYHPFKLEEKFHIECRV